MALILELPVELSIAIAKEFIESRDAGVPNETVIANVADLQALSLTCRSFRSIVKQLLFDWNKKHGHSNAVVWALEHGRTDTLEDCRAFGLDLLAPGSHHHTNDLNSHFDLEAPFCCQVPIGVAISHHQPAAVEWLLDSGVSADQLCSAVDQVAPFNAATVSLPADEEEYAPRWTALEYAMSHRSSSISTLLIQKGATLTFPHNAHSRGAKKQHAIHMAAEKGLVDVINMLVCEHDVDVNTADTDGETALHHAVNVLDNKDTILPLYYLGADLNRPAANGVTPLVKALRSGCYANAFQLIVAGAAVKSPFGLQSPLRACLMGQPRDRFSLVGAIWLNLDDKYYMGYEPDEDEKADVFRGRILEIMIEKGASVHDEYAGEPMPILTALHHYQELTVQVLLHHGVQFPEMDGYPSMAAYVVATNAWGFGVLREMQILFNCGFSRLDDPYDENTTVLQALVARGIPYILSGMLQMGKTLVDPEHLSQVIWDCIRDQDRPAIDVFARLQLGVAWRDSDRTELQVL
ncbi:hypothetical protein PG985_002444 [Apiospora marii]|uniref:F-box domain-containing protein n=1 Tax=Apiospora marii TaxID=335849 RepID=A0ABR1RT46_9PEZI